MVILKATNIVRRSEIQGQWFFFLQLHANAKILKIHVFKYIQL